jgi:hypothetical protein
VEAGNLEIVKLMMNSMDTKVLLSPRLDDGRDALRLAIESKNCTLVKFLIQFKAHELIPINWMSLMKMIIKFVLIELVEEFLIISEDIFETDSIGIDIFGYALEKRREYFLYYFIQNGFDPKGRGIKNLLKYKKSLNSIADQITNSVIENRSDLLKLLIDETNFTTLNFGGNNILAQSIESYQMEIFDFIVKNLNWKELNVKNHEGILPIHMALQRGNYHVIRTFCQLSESPVKLDHLCFEKTRIHKSLFDFLKQWSVLKSTKSLDISFRFQ